MREKQWLVTLAPDGSDDGYMRPRGPKVRAITAHSVKVDDGHLILSDTHGAPVYVAAPGAYIDCQPASAAADSGVQA